MDVVWCGLTHSSAERNLTGFLSAAIKPLRFTMCPHNFHNFNKWKYCYLSFIDAICIVYFLMSLNNYYLIIACDTSNCFDILVAYRSPATANVLKIENVHIFKKHSGSNIRGACSNITRHSRSRIRIVRIYWSLLLRQISKKEEILFQRYFTLLRSVSSFHSISRNKKLF